MKKVIVLSLWLCLTACYRPPYNQFHAPIPVLSIFKDNHATLLRDLKRYDIQVVHYGDQITLIVPTDRYFLFNREEFDELQYPGLEAIVHFIQLYPRHQVTIAGFSDNVGTTRKNLLLTDARAHTMLTFLWSYGIPTRQLSAQGYGEAYPIGDNHFIHGAAYNRRLEIQWPVEHTDAVLQIRSIKRSEMKP